MNFKRHRPKRQRAGCDCGGKVFKRFKRRGQGRALAVERRILKEQR